MKHYVGNEITRILNEYKNNAKRIVADYNKEISVIGDYNGRQILELLQNADDAAMNIKKSKVLIEYKNGVLRVSNNGIPFSKKGVDSLIYSNLSSKNEESDTIGQKGLGFRALLNWSKTIKIISGELKLQFSKQTAIDYLESIIIERPEIENEIRNHTSDKHPIATLAVPRWMENDVVELDDGYNTCVEIECSKKFHEEILNQLYQIDSTTMLFINNIEEIKLVIDNDIKQITSVLDSSVLTVSEIDFDNSSISHSYQIYTKQGNIEDKAYLIKIAEPLDFELKDNYLYSYFKTKINMPFKFLAHATLDLKTDRNNLVKNEQNKVVLDSMLDFLFEIALMKRKDNPDYEALSFVLRHKEFDESLNDDFGFEKHYFELIKSKSIFPTPSGNYINNNEILYLTNSDYSKVLDRNDMTRILCYFKDSVLEKDLCKLIEDSKIDYESIGCQYLFELVEKAEISKYPSKIVFFLENVIKDYHHIPFRPKIFESRQNNLVGKHDGLYWIDDEMDQALPNFDIGSNIINDNVQKELSSYFEPEKLNNILGKFRITRLNLLELVTNIKSTVNKNYTYENKNELNLIIKYLIRLYASGKLSDVLVAVIEDTNFYCLNGEIVALKDMYFGIDYNNSFLTRLFNGISRVNYLPTIEEMELNEIDNDLIVRFFEKVGVSKYPKKLMYKSNISRYPDYIANSFRFNEKIVVPYHAVPISNNEDLVKKTYNNNTMIVENIDNLSEILQKSSFEDIIAWFALDNNVYDLITNPSSKKNKLVLLLRKKRNESTVENFLTSFVKYIVESTKWISTLSGIKSSPDVCLFTKNSKLDFSPAIEVVKVDYKFEIFEANNISRQKIDSIIRAIGIATKITEFDHTQIYSILKQLPDIDGEMKVSSNIYRQIVVNYDVEDLLTDSTERNDFLSEGSVLATRMSESDFYPISEVFYIDNKRYSEEVINRFPMLNLGKRLGEKKVQKILGIKPLQGLEFSLVEEEKPHFLSEDFKLFWMSFIPYVYCYRVEQDNNLSEKASLLNIEVNICSDFTVNYKFNEKDFLMKVENYEYIYFEKIRKILIKVPDQYTNFKELKYNFDFSNAISEMITSILKVGQNRKDYRELFPLNNRDRNRVIANEFDDDSLEILKRSNEILELSDLQRFDFWEPILRMKSIDVGLLDEYIESCGINELDIIYDDINNIFSLKRIRDLFKDEDVKLEDYNLYASTKLDFTKLIENEFNAYKFKNKISIYSRLYSYLKGALLSEKLKFENYKDEYEFLIVRFDNEINPNYEAILESNYMIYKTIENFNDSVNIKNEYKHNLKALIEITNKQEAFMQFIKIKENRSLVYFNEVDELISRFKNYTHNMIIANDENESISKESHYEVSTKEIDSNKLKVGEKDKGKTKRKSKPSYSPIKNDKAEKTKYSHGLRAEQKVYDELCEQYKKKNVSWVSAYASEIGEDPDGKDGYGYDLSYWDSNGVLKYVEVKSISNNERSFHISGNEIRTAQKYGKDYYIYLCTFNKDKVSIDKIANLMDFDDGENIYDNTKFTLDIKDSIITLGE